jgi:Tfp pilus assembly PilM family ATPase
VALLKNVVGLDVGSRSVRAVELRATLRGVEAVQMCEVERDGDLPLAELLRRFVRLHGLPTEHVVCALPGDRTAFHPLAFPFAERRRLAQAVPFEVEAELPFEMDDYLVDWEVAGGDRARTLVLATLAPRAQVSELLGVLGDAGCAPRTLEAEGPVLANLAAAFDLPGTRLVADIGQRKATFCVVTDGRPVLARSSAAAGLALTRALARDRGLPVDEAERVKCEQGVFDAAGGAGPETTALLDRLVRDLALVLAAAEPRLADLAAAPVGAVSLVGGGALLDRLDAYLAERLGVETARLGLPREGEAPGLAAGGSPVTFAPAIALALRGTARARTRTNFRQDEFAVRLDLARMREDFRWTGWLAAAAAGLALLGWGTATLLESRRVDAIEREIARLYGGAFPGRPVPEGAAHALGEAVRTANERAEFLGVYRGNLSALDLLTEISRHVPADLDVVLEELTIDRQLVRMRVYAKSFEASDRLRGELAKLGPFASVHIGAIETDRKTGGKRFNVTISLGEAEEPA